MTRQTLADIQNAMMRAYISTVNGNTKKNISRVKTALYPVVFDAVYNCDELESVRSGKLKYDFGLVNDPTHEIASSVANSIQVRFSPFKYISGIVTGGSTINVQPSAYPNLLAIASSILVTEKGAVLPWLDWLLNYGDSIIIADFGVRYTNAGRTGGAIMVEGKGPFRVDPTHSGTPGDNFVTRALNSRAKEIEDKIWQTILN